MLVMKKKKRCAVFGCNDDRLFLLRHVYFPWDRINWIKEEQSSDGKDFIIPRDLLKPVSIKLRVRYEKLQKKNRFT